MDYFHSFETTTIASSFLKIASSYSLASFLIMTTTTTQQHPTYDDNGIWVSLAVVAVLSPYVYSAIPQRKAGMSH